MAELAHPDFTDPIVDHYDMYALILQAQAAAGTKVPAPQEAALIS
jgi:alpha-D-ribose 1-methylphosphonate 5-triphosphate synthase subunit PhnH